MKKITRRWMLVYSIFFGLLSIFYVMDNFENGYAITFCLWSVAFYVLVLLGNLLFSFNYITVRLRAIWKVVFPIVILEFILAGIIDVKYGTTARRHGVTAIIVSYFFSFLLFFPTFKAHYAIGYRKEAQQIAPRTGALAVFMKVSNIIGGIFIGLCMFILLLSGLASLLLTGRVAPLSDSDFAAIARQGEPIAQAIHDYQSEHGLLPLELSDLTPDYLTNRPPEDWYFTGNELSHHTGFRDEVCYRFTGDTGWAVFGDDINDHHLDVSGPTNKGPVLTGQALFNAKLAEYERRISKNTNAQSSSDETKVLCDDKIGFLVYAGRQDLLRAECKRDIGLFPDWWLPQIALAEANWGDGYSEKRFAEWVHQHPTFANYWYLSRYYRDKGDIPTAMGALEKAATSAFEMYPDYTRWDASLYAFDAAQFSYENGKNELTLKLCHNCEPKPGSWEGETLLEYEAAAELKMMQFDAAITDAQQVVTIANKQPMDVQIILPNLWGLLAAAKEHDTNYMYRANETPPWPMFVQPHP